MTQFHLRLFGLPVLSGPDGPLTGAPVQRHRLALLALLARAPGHCLSRDKIMALLWPEADSRQARHLLNVSVHELRKALGEEVLLSQADDLRLAVEHLRVDVPEFESRIAGGDVRGGAKLWVGPFLDGFYLENNPEFDQWTATEREGLLARYREALSALAEDATVRGARVEAVDWCRRHAATDPFNSRLVLHLMTALEAAGDPGNAVEVARVHEGTLRRELGASPDAAVLQLAERLRHAPAAPAAPPALAGRVDQPRAAEPMPGTAAQRPRRLAMAWAAAALAVALLAFALWPSRPPAVTGRLLVLPFANQTGDPSLEPLGRIIADRITDGLARMDTMDVVDFRVTLMAMQQDGAKAADAARAGELARQTGASRLVTGSYRLEGDNVVISARLSNVASGRVEAVLGEISAPVSDPMAAVDELRDRGMGAVAALGSRRLGEPAAEGGPAPRYQAYLEYIEGVGRLSWLDRGFEALPSFLRAVRLDSTFEAPLFWATYLVERCVRFQVPQSGWGHCSIGLRDSLLAALERVAPTLGPIERHGLAYLHAMAAGDEDAAWVAISSASRLSPQSLWTAEAIELANERGAFEEVIRLADAAGIADGWSREMSSNALTSAYHALGRFQDELSVARNTRGTFPDAFIHRAIELRAMAALGWTDSVRSGLHGIVARWGPLQGADVAQMLMRHLRGHGFPEAARAVGQRCSEFFFADSGNTATPYAYMGAVCLHGAGRPAEARRLFERIAAEGGQFREFSLQWLGVLAAQAENRSLAEQYLRQLVPPGDDSTNMYARARIAAALGDHELAVTFLRRWIANNPLGRANHKDAPDPGWESIQSYPPYRALIDRNH